MNRDEVRRFHGERGASLILAIAFMVVVGGISSAVLATTSSGLQSRVALDQARNREYAADGAIETTVVAARALSGACPTTPTLLNLNNVTIHVDCTPVPAVVDVGPTGTLRTQNDLSFVACLAIGGGTPCTLPTGTDPPIITAQVNFQGTAPNVTTWVQGWSVNG